MIRLSLLTLLLLAPAALAEPGKRFAAPAPPAGFPKFEVEEIDVGLKIGYAVIVADVDGDKKPDIVVVDQHKVVWYQNPTWQKRTILDGKTKPDNVCIAAVDIDGDGLPEFILGAGWKPFDTKTPGTLQWLKRGKTLDDEWSMHPIPCDEPTVHRIQMIRLEGSNKPPLLVSAPLMGREATKEKNWMDGRPVHITAYRIPTEEPEKPENWKAKIFNERLRVVHNFARMRDTSVVVASCEGLHAIMPATGGAYVANQIGSGDQGNPAGNRGSSEVALGWSQKVPLGHMLDGVPRFRFMAAIEPWHGNKVVVYDPHEKDPGDANLWKRTVIDDHLRWGHAVKFAYLEPPLTETGSQIDNLIVGVRDNPDPKEGDTFTEKRGVRIYRHDDKAKKWERFILEDGGVAVEDLAVADLDGDGRPDIVAVGRATGNARIYWNKGK